MTYYGLPKPATVAGWAARVPEGFTFVVKVHQQTTHQRDNETRELATLHDLLGPLRERSMLGGLLAQFPASFHANRDSERYLALLAERVEGVPIFVEFRHGSWDRAEAVTLCRELGLGWVAVDLPPLRNLPPPRPAVTTDTGYVRLHGRNSSTWYHPENGDRYDWNYTDRELGEWVPRLKAMDMRSESTFLFFNNCHMGWAVKNALTLKALLTRQFEVV